MKNFTKSLFDKALPLLVGLFLFNLGFVGQLDAQTCDINNIAGDTISKIIGNTGDSLLFDFVDFDDALDHNCSGPTSDSLHMAFDVDYPSGATRDTIFLGNNGAYNAGTSVTVTCSQDLDKVQDSAIKIPSGAQVTFFSSPSSTNAAASGFARVDNVTLFIVDNSPPNITLPASVVSISCIEDTTAYDTVATLPLSPGGNVILGPTDVADPCSGVADTIYTQTFDYSHGMDTVLAITRTWTFVDSSGNTTTPFTQVVYVIDNQVPFWMDPTGDISSYEFAGDAFPTTMGGLLADSIRWNGTRRLHVFLERSDPNFQPALDYWAATFRPNPVDDCSNNLDTLNNAEIPAGFVTELLNFKDTIEYNCVDNQGDLNGEPDVGNLIRRVRRRFIAEDSVGNTLGSNTSRNAGGNFILQIYISDNQPPLVVDTPLVNVNGAERMDLDFSDMRDSFIVFVDQDTCGKFIDTSEISIKVRDVVSLDLVEYKWAVTSSPGTTPPGMLNSGAFSDTDTSAAQFYPTGEHVITYEFTDTCGNIGTHEVYIDVRTIPPVVIKHPDTTFFDGFIPDLASTGNDKKDIFILFNDVDTCGAMTTGTGAGAGVNTGSGSGVGITAIDAFDGDDVEYAWKIKPSVGSPMPTDTLGNPTTKSMNGIFPFSSAHDRINLFFGVGEYELTYLFRDTSDCPNTDSITYILRVVDTAGTEVIDYPNTTPFFTGTGDSTLLQVVATTADCGESVTYEEPNYTNFDYCSTTKFFNDSIGLEIERKIVKGGSDNIFDGKPVVDPFATGSGDREVTAFFPVDTTVVRYIFRDSIGNSDSIDLTVIVSENEAPTANCPMEPITLTRNSGTCDGQLVSYRSLFTDNCTPQGDLIISQLPAAGTTLTADTTMVTVSATDVSGNTSVTCSFMVILEELPPAPVLGSLPSASTQCNTIILDAPQATTCDGNTIFAIPSGQFNIVSTNRYEFTKVSTSLLVEWKYVDVTNNTVTSQFQQVTFNDDVEKPALNAVSSYNLALDTLGNATLMASALNNGTTDNCTPDSLIALTISPDTMVTCASLDSTFSVTLTATDEAGNDSSTTVTINVVDLLPPTFTDVPEDDTLSCPTEALPDLVNPVIADNCGIDTMYMKEFDNRPDTNATTTFADLARTFAYFNYDVTRRWVAVDASGNRDSVDQVIRVRDNEGPVIPYGDSLLVESTPDITTCSAILDLNLKADIMDACATDTLITQVSFDGVTFIDTMAITLDIPMGEDTIWIRAYDAIGNRSTQMVRLIVDDKTAPTAVCKDVSVSVNGFGILVMNEQIINGGSFDNCSGALTYSFDRDTFTCADVGAPIPVTMTVTDANGNSSSCISNVTIQDFTGTAAFNCPDPVTIACDASTAPDSTGGLNLSVSNVCQRGIRIDFEDVYKAAPANNDNICQVIERTWMAFDTIANTVTTCVQLISLVDEEAPEFDTTFANAVVDCIDEAATADSILVTDNCEPMYYAHAMDSIFNGSDTITLRRIWTATDSCNVVRDTQYIKIFDEEDPTIMLPMDTFVYNTGDFVPDSCGVLIPAIDFAEYVMECNASLPMGLTVRHNAPGNDTSSVFARYLPVGTHDYMVMATDASGNSVSAPFVIKINDTSTPTLVCVENLVVSLGTGGTGVLSVANVLSSVIDNCGGESTIDTFFLSQTTFDCSDLGMKQISLTAIDMSGNESTCLINLEVVNQGNTAVIDIATASQPESIVGANDGIAWVTVTGGSGNYTYSWSPGGGTTDTIRDLAPNLYTVVVNDMDTGCRLTDTIRVETGSTVNYTLGDVSGTAGSIVQVPVTVTNFNNVVSIDMAFSLSSSVGSFVPGNFAGGFNVGGLNEDNFGLDPSNSNRLLLAVDTDFNSTTGESVADGTEIFYINVQLAGSVGDSVNVTAGGNTMANPMTGIILDNSAVDLVASVSPGTVKIADMDPAVSFGGNVSTVEGDPLEKVLVTLSGDQMGTDSTDASGDYEFTVLPNQSLVVRPWENRNHKQGLTVTDLALIQAHILGTTLDSPFKVLAADVNNSKSVTVTDLAIIQAVILENIPAFPAVPSWRFVPADFTPMSGTDSLILNQPLPDSIATVSDTADFIGFKMGDANLSANSVAFTSNESAESRSTFHFGLEDRYLKAGDLIEVPFKAKDFKEMYAYQMTLNANVEWLTFEGVQAGTLTTINDGNFGLNKSAKGLISTLWYSSKPLSIEQNATLFTISFRVNKGGKYLSDILQASSDIIAAEAHADNRNPQNISLTFDRRTAVEGFELFQNRPNPFGAETTISFSLPKAMPATIRFFDFSGRMVHQLKADYDAGLNSVVIQKNDLAGTGVIYYELATPEFTARKKMIVLE